MPNQTVNKLWLACLWPVLALCCTVISFAQTSAGAEPAFIVPARPTVSNPAEFQRPGVLQLEYGYNANFHVPGISSVIDLPVALRFAASHRILLEADIDGFISQKTAEAGRATSFGDCQFGIQFVLHKDQTAPGMAIAYYVKAPTASSSKGLGTGRVDHSLLALVSKKFGGTTLDFNAIYLLAGRVSTRGHASSGQAAFAVSRDLPKKFGIQGELSGFSRNDLQPGAMLGLAVGTYQVNRRLVLDGGFRFGLTHAAPRSGVVVGMTVGIANRYKKEKQN